MRMDFGKILDKWENKEDRKKPAHANFEKWIEKHGVRDKDISSGTTPEDKQEKIQLRNILRSMKPQAEIDLHGLKKNEALLELKRFLEDSRRKGLKKVLIIHGKGFHSQQGPILGKAVREYLEQTSLTGETGTADRRYGGKGALWAIIR